MVFTCSLYSRLIRKLLSLKRVVGATQRRIFRSLSCFVLKSCLPARTSRLPLFEHVYSEFFVPRLLLRRKHFAICTHSAKFVQYWSQGDPPSDIKAIIEMWNNALRLIKMGPICLYSRESALSYIKNNAPDLELPFETAFHYAVESDIFRIAIASTEPCVWIDSDSTPSTQAPVVLLEALASAVSTYSYGSPKRMSIVV